jgi:hypothetical protein
MRIKGLEIDWINPIPIHIRMDLGQSGETAGKQPTLYRADKASYSSYDVDGFKGDTRIGGTCNFGDVKINPHLNGTHTECSGHITLERRYITDIDTLSPKLGMLITVTGTKLNDTDESYAGDHDKDDEVISALQLRQALNKGIDTSRGIPDCMIIRFKPNDESKKYRDYSDIIPPYFTSEAINLLNSYGFEHLMTDLPSIDRTSDGGVLDNHHRFFGYTKQSQDKPLYSEKTVTEMVFVPNNVHDGTYALFMNVAQWELDAAPSYPVLFAIKKNELN